ncbi:hypothetical protein OCGS_1320 [Oceaniovalibus guishaninsula JLT2003]|uniref:CysZ-like protein n=1 Tax=Oceaniovalibus guishaninsula JLT2003 TaxID=1231392 RepID=K2HD21_9RHOB|nr:EI24 domain-containing protein [Oceaniovalibus guishaninsula]EKE44482.1 hypothetical protein OCGS_1320 [Oceaniovalibus guishaninsula JLT2003]
MTIARDVSLALAQMGDRRFRGVLLRGIGLTLALLVGATALVAWGIGWLLPDSVSLPWIGPVGWLDNLASGAGGAAMLVLSVFLMIPVASFCTSFFLDDVTDAVEARYYPALAPAPRLGLAEGLAESLSFLGVLLVANVVALIAYLLVVPAAPFIFLALNGYLLGREYFQLVARRRLGAQGARALRKRHAARIWLAGIVMAVPLLVPVVNLLVPVLGAATFTHLTHRLMARASSGRTSPDRAR